MDLDQVRAEHERLGAWAHLATVCADGSPHAVPVHPCWEGDTLWIMSGLSSVHTRNLARRGDTMLHWQVGESSNFDSLMIWGAAEIHDDLDTRRRLWEGVFDYDLSMFAPEGPDDAADVGFVAVTPTRAVVLRFFGSQGREEWSAD